MRVLEIKFKCQLVEVITYSFFQKSSVCFHIYYFFILCIFKVWGRKLNILHTCPQRIHKRQTQKQMIKNVNSSVRHVHEAVSVHRTQAPKPVKGIWIASWRRVIWTEIPYLCFIYTFVGDSLPHPHGYGERSYSVHHHAASLGHKCLGHEWAHGTCWANQCPFLGFFHMGLTKAWELSIAMFSAIW